MISGEVESKYIRIEIIEGRSKESFEKKIAKAVNSGAMPLFETFSVTNQVAIMKKKNYSKGIYEFFVNNDRVYSMLVGWDDTGKSLRCEVGGDNFVK